ncbi:MAG: hypothetical protein HYY44_07700 [Deltaproteobacteria bacterium]|nr:hypothetical protein [Deltaproteobacteria bacterium]MBI4373840.1 hypothetical protein [Deltaproteobacteria bacterium]
MEAREERVHTTFNLSRRLIREARSFLKDRTITEVIHEALERLIRMEKRAQHIKKWAGKGHFRSYG